MCCSDACGSGLVHTCSAVSCSAGASPISAEVMMFLRVCFGCHVLEGYGMTGARLGRHRLLAVPLVGDAVVLAKANGLVAVLAGQPVSPVCRV
jgi:hypothetical protein